MITDKQKELVTGVIKAYAHNPSTDFLLRYVAEHDGVLHVCSLLIDANKNTHDAKLLQWLYERCHTYKIDARLFLVELTNIMAILRPDKSESDYYQTLGLTPGACAKEVKQAYRTLSRKYHPDAAGADNDGAKEKFIQINAAYHAIQQHGSVSHKKSNSPAPAKWHQNKKRGVSKAKKKKNVLWFSLFAGILVILSIFISIAYNKRVMLAGLRQNTAAFVPPQQTTPDVVEQAQVSYKNEEPLLVTERKDTQPSLAERHDKAAVIQQHEIENEPGKQDLTGSTQPIGEQNEEPFSAHKDVLSNLEKELAKIEHSKDDLQLIDSQPRKPENGKTGTHRDEEGEEEVLNGHTPQINPTPRAVPAQKKAKQDHTLDDGRDISSPKTKILNNRTHPAPSITQKDIEAFINGYIQAYDDRNLSTFSQYFATDAIENGQPVTTLTEEYTALFRTTEAIKLDISVIQWQQEEKSVSITGRFSISISYKNEENIDGHGNIHFILDATSNKLQIQKMMYHFDKS